MNVNMKFMAKETWKKEQNSSGAEFAKESSECVVFHPKNSAFVVV